MCVCVRTGQAPLPRAHAEGRDGAPPSPAVLAAAAATMVSSEDDSDSDAGSDAAGEGGGGVGDNLASGDSNARGYHSSQIASGVPGEAAEALETSAVTESATGEDELPQVDITQRNPSPLPFLPLARQALPLVRRSQERRTVFPGSLTVACAGRSRSSDPQRPLLSCGAPLMRCLSPLPPPPPAPHWPSPLLPSSLSLNPTISKFTGVQRSAPEPSCAATQGGEGTGQQADGDSTGAVTTHTPASMARGAGVEVSYTFAFWSVQCVTLAGTPPLSEVSLP